MCTCEEALALINQAIDGCISETDRARLEEHLSRCSSCAAVYEAYRELQAGMLELTQPVPETFAKGVMWRVHNDGKRKGRRFAFGGASALCAAAALLLLLVSTGTLDRFRSGATGNAASPSSAETAPADTAVQDKAADAGRGYFLASGDADGVQSSDTLDTETADEAAGADGDAGAEKEQVFLSPEAPEENTKVDSAAREAASEALPDVQDYACVLTIEAPVEALPGLSGLTAYDGGFYCEETVQQAGELAADYGEAYPMQLQWNDETAGGDAPALIVIPAQTNQN